MKIVTITENQASAIGVTNCHGVWSTGYTATNAKTEKAARAWVKRVSEGRGEWAVWLEFDVAGRPLGWAAGPTS